LIWSAVGWAGKPIPVRHEWTVIRWAYRPSLPRFWFIEKHYRQSPWIPAVAGMTGKSKVAG
jgi:hypothetical protein